MGDEGVVVSFEVWSPPPPSDFRLIVTGSHAQLGNWYTEKPVSMTLQGEGVWKVELTFKSSDHFEYKYACYSDKEGRCVGYEQGPNRQVFLPLKLQQDQAAKDSRTNLRRVTLKDVWSSVPSQQPPFGNSQPRGPMPGFPNMMGQQSMYGSQPMYGFQSPQYAMHMGGYYQPPPQAYMHQRPPNQMMMSNNDPGMLGQQMQRPPQQQHQPPAQLHHQPPSSPQHQHQQHHQPQQQQQPQQPPLQQAPQQHRAPLDQELGSRLTKVVGEVSGLKKKLKESQREHREEQRRAKELEESYQLKIGELQGKIGQLTDEADRLRREKEEIRQTALNSGKEAAAAEAAESMARQLKEAENRLAQAERKWAQEREELASQLRAAKESAGKFEASAVDLKSELEARDTELAIVTSGVDGFSAGVKDEVVRQLVSNRQVPLHDRLSTLLKYLETEANKKNPAVYTDLLARCADLRSTFQVQYKKMKQDIQTAVDDVGELVKRPVKEFVEAKEQEKQVYVERYYKQFDERKRLANELVDLKGKIRVFGRARPFNKRERENGHSNVLAFPESNRLLIGMNAEAYMMANDVAEGVDTEMGQNNIEDVKTYELDHIFGPKTTQEEVFEEVRHLVGSVLDGYNVTVFAYGQTGSGKTFTMDGSRENPGITFRSLGMFFDSGGELRRSLSRSGSQKIQRRKSVLKPKVEVEISMLEIYNEEIRDLLCEPGSKTKLEVRQSPDGGSYVPNLTKLPAASLQEALAVMDQGRENRKTSATKMNATSSRSHMVFTAYLTVTSPANGDKTNSKLHLVDLAGSERVSKTGASGEQLKEAMSINKSLSALGDVIASLTSKSDKGHVPYRNSKLTFLLQDSLCGHSRTAMFVNLSPSSDNYWETISTLNFGARAASVELGEVQKNFESGELATLRAQISQLQGQVVSHKGAAGDVAEELGNLRNRASELEKDVDVREKKLKLLMAKNEELAAELDKQEDAAGKRLERVRQDLKAKDDRVKELEELVKKSKKDVADVQKGQSAEIDSAQKELTTLRRQVQEQLKAIKQLEVKAQASEGKAKKLEQKVSKAEEEARVTREALAKAKQETEAAKQEVTVIRQLAEAANADAAARRDADPPKKSKSGKGKNHRLESGRLLDDPLNVSSGLPGLSRKSTASNGDSSGSSKQLDPMSPVGRNPDSNNSRKSVREIRLGL